MPRVRIIKKNDEYSSEYDLGDIFEITGTWYGGVHIEGKSGVPVSSGQGRIYGTGHRTAGAKKSGSRRSAGAGHSCRRYCATF